MQNIQKAQNLYTNQFVTAVSNLGYTENGALTYNTTNSALLDFFSRGAVSNPEVVVDLFTNAYKEDKLFAIKIAMYLRDVRDGQGKRDVIRAMISALIKQGIGDVEVLTAVLPFIPLVGRWSDVFESASVLPHSVLQTVKQMIITGLSDDFHKSLVGKWLPRKGENAKVLTKLLELTPREYRKLVVAYSNTVEQKMCAKQWDEIDFGKLPSRAAKVYQKAFMRNTPDNYQNYVDSLVKGEAKVNSATLFPADIVRAIRCNIGNSDVLNAQWEALPNYMEGCTMNILPVIDVSGSMDCPAYGNTTAMDVSVSLGMYLSTRNEGEFKNLWCNFSETPKIFSITGDNITQQYHSIIGTSWGYSTNLQSVFDLILNRAVSTNVPANDMPKAIIIISDMEFDSASSPSKTNFEVIKEKYKASGYELPIVVFWNANSRADNTPVTKDEQNVILVGGYSPVIMKHILANNLKPITPMQMMIDTISPKYSYLDAIFK